MQQVYRLIFFILPGFALLASLHLSDPSMAPLVKSASVFMLLLGIKTSDGSPESQELNNHE